MFKAAITFNSLNNYQGLKKFTGALEICQTIFTSTLLIKIVSNIEIWAIRLFPDRRLSDRWYPDSTLILTIAYR